MVAILWCMEVKYPVPAVVLETDYKLKLSIISVWSFVSLRY